MGTTTTTTKNKVEEKKTCGNRKRKPKKRKKERKSVKIKWKNGEKNFLTLALFKKIHQNTNELNFNLGLVGLMLSVYHVLHVPYSVGFDANLRIVCDNYVDHGV